MGAENCPARYGRGADIRTAAFRFVADDFMNGPDGVHTMSEILVYFLGPSGYDADDDNVLLAAELEVPIGSPIDQLAQAVQADPDGAMRRVGEQLRSLIAACPCTGYEECPALSALSLVTAMERAQARQPRAWQHMLPRRWR